ncbi:MAG: serine/threonine-protein kinase, partial [Nocardioides sp.]
MSITPSPEDAGRPAGPGPGFTVDGYHLLTRIGEGGMGVVHLAQRPGGHRVALKVLRPHIVGDDEARSRLAREVGSLSRIRSAGVAEIVDADPWGDIPYVATRYVPGLSLHDHVREEGAIAGDDLIWFAVKLAEALLSVHQHGVLHRDVKPSNVLMEGRTPILIDFGLARVADDPKLTHTGWLLGTPGYLAPEILHGDDATTAADVHSWASTVAFAGLGRPPFGRGPAMAVMDRVRRGEHQLEGLPEPVRAVVHAALHPDPTRRPDLPELLVRLREVRPPRAVPRYAPTFEDDLITAPLAVAALAGADDLTRAGTTYRDHQLTPPTLVEPHDRGEDPRWSHQQPPWGPPAT